MERNTACFFFLFFFFLNFSKLTWKSGEWDWTSHEHEKITTAPARVGHRRGDPRRCPGNSPPEWPSRSSERAGRTRHRLVFPPQRLRPAVSIGNARFRVVTTPRWVTFVGGGCMKSLKGPSASLRAWQTSEDEQVMHSTRVRVQSDHLGPGVPVHWSPKGGNTGRDDKTLAIILCVRPSYCALHPAIPPQCNAFISLSLIGSTNVLHFWFSHIIKCFLNNDALLYTEKWHILKTS